MNFSHLKMKKLFFLITILFFSISLYAQNVYYHTSNKDVYDFLDEFANLKVIDIHTTVKPFSRMFIAEKLTEVKESSYSLNSRQQAELDFYFKDFNKELRKDKNFDKRLDLYTYKDSLFTFSVNPILGIEYFMNDSGSFYHRWNGAEAFAYVGNHWGFYASLRDNHESTILEKEDFLTQRTGANYKYTDDGGDYSEMRGGLTYSWNWGSLGIVKDHFEWGNNYNGANIFSGHTPSFAHIKLQLKPAKWFEFNWVHGWLVSEVVDSASSMTFTNAYGTDTRDVMFDKYLAANLFTFKPWNNFYVSLGNSIIYSSDGPQLQYLIPVMFYKSVDHTYNATDQSGRNVGQNSQMFIDISSRNIKKVHLSVTLFIDELSTDRFFNDTMWNFWSFKAGTRISDFITNTFITAEYTRSMPLTYKHNIPTTTFESNGYNLGHYLMDNSHEFYFSVIVKPFRTLILKADYLFAQKGKDYDDLGGSRLGNPFMDNVEWENKTVSLRASYQVINDGYIFVKYQHSEITGDNIKYTPAYYYGTRNTISLGANIGF
ncbi:MAG: hypothetical protein A2X13_11675 [Bacteroidetes bacterium GWC2_33_15]|nr:MAG: hypothetical protein A2X10_05700 [Bacteroidetes bacterium GWA2_33_15]OFX50797.1 MAG: hypothetical protein A2X13_11675 [Bacteroidetes bacterium GWC2_33_15]OFX62920.1 MAG: hypothetical protein A2X15_09695 [Bacteroidetes bacterium GWB2_32_14]OFX69990.1 MAG: hypothetical protein A2X14_02555 [Bacteroidetes bacterium GWD2_33_33]